MINFIIHYEACVMFTWQSNIRDIADDVLDSLISVANYKNTDEIKSTVTDFGCDYI